MLRLLADDKVSILSALTYDLSIMQVYTGGIGSYALLVMLIAMLQVNQLNLNVLIV